MTFLVSAKWVESNLKNPLNAATACRLTIAANEKVLTKAYDQRAETVTDSVHLSVYPLALWFASSFWRLLHEPKHQFGVEPSIEWKMSHCMPAAGHGYIWPDICFETDGMLVAIISKSHDILPSEPINYLANERENISAEEFEECISGFIQFVVNRLNARGIEDSDLHAIWAEIKNEKNDHELAAYRAIEAAAGWDPDEINSSDISELMDLGSKIGCDPAMEIAKASQGQKIGDLIRTLLEMDKLAGIPGYLDLKLLKSLSFVAGKTAVAFPWDLGRQLAHQARKQLGIDEDAVTTDRLRDALGIPPSQDLQPGTASRTFPMAFATRKDFKGEVAVHFRSNHPSSRRFSMARIFADAVLRCESPDVWLPITDSTSYRQRVQRAFAAEFLCPIERLVEFLGGDFSEDRQQDASDHFEVSLRTIGSHLANNNILPSHIPLY